MSTGSDAGEQKIQHRKKIRILYNNPPGQRSKGETAVAIKKEITHKVLNIRTTIQVVSLEVYLVGKGKRAVCFIHFPLTNQVTKENMKDLLEQFPALIILL